MKLLRPPIRSSRRWETEEVAALKRMAKRRTSAWVIAKRLKRSEGAVRFKAFALGLSLETRPGAFLMVTV